MRIDNKKYKIFIVEDNPGDFFLVQDYLGEIINQPKITRAKNYKETKQILSEGNCAFDVILLDITLPDKQGKELIESVISFCKKTPVVIFTGYTNLDFAIESLSMGVSDYLLKDELNASLLHKSIVYNIERNKNLVKLQESKQKYSDLFHLSPQPMWVYNTATLKFLDVNDAAIKHYFYSKSEFLEMEIKDLCPEEELPELKSIMKKLIEKNEVLFTSTLRHKKKNGQLINVELKSNDILYNGTEARIVLANDITDRITYLNAIEDQNKRLKEIAWIQSHIVRAPLSRIMGLANMIKSNIIDLTSEDREEFLTHILSSADELDEIIKNVTLKTKEFDLKE